MNWLPEAWACSAAHTTWTPTSTTASLFALSEKQRRKERQSRKENWHPQGPEAHKGTSLP